MKNTKKNNAPFFSLFVLFLGEPLTDDENEILGDDQSGIASDESGEDLFGDDFER